MYTHFKWTDASLTRNRVLQKFEPIQPYIFLAFCDYISAQIVLDIGANIGAYSLFSAKIPSVTEVHAFEADIDTYAELQKNIDLNGATKVHPRQVAVSVMKGEVDFLVAGTHSGTNAIASTTIHPSTIYSHARRVQTEALDGMFDFKSITIAMKIDVEGHELSVLTGATQLLSHNECVIQVEIYKGGDELRNLLLGSGYKPIFRSSNDWYFTNSHRLATQTSILNSVELAIDSLVNYTKAN